MANRAITLGELGRREEELAAFDEMVGRFGEAPEAALRVLVARALELKKRL